MRTANKSTPRSFEEMKASIPEGMRNQPLTVAKFFDFMALLVKANKALQQRVAQLEQQASNKGDGHG